MATHMIGPYQFIKFINMGTSGVVWECRNCQTNEPVACKAVDLRNIVNDSFWKHFKNELIVHSQIHHSAIAQVKDVLVDATHIYVMVEMCDGGDLGHFVQAHSGLSESQARHYFWRIMDAISYIHERGVAHRDIKLENILITSADEAKLTDFGLCKIQTIDSPMMTTRCGTLAYVAPEILKGGEEPYDGMKADIWSAGIVLYAMVANHLPWSEDESLPPETLMQETTRQILEGDIALPNVSWELQDLIGSMLIGDPEERPSASDVMQHPWMEAGAESDGQSTDPDPQLVQRVVSLIQDLERSREQFIRSQQA